MVVEGAMQVFVETVYTFPCLPRNDARWLGTDAAPREPAGRKRRHLMAADHPSLLIEPEAASIRDGDGSIGFDSLDQSGKAVSKEKIIGIEPTHQRRPPVVDRLVDCRRLALVRPPPHPGQSILPAFDDMQRAVRRAGVCEHDLHRNRLSK